MQRTWRQEDSWRKARAIAQHLLHYTPNLKNLARQQVEGPLDPALEEMVAIVKQGITVRDFNQYHQAFRDELAVNKEFFNIVAADIVIILDKADKPLLFQLTKGLQILLDNGVKTKAEQSFNTYSTLQPVPLPDSTRHGLHWVKFLKERPELDFRIPGNDLRKATSGAYYHGAHFGTGNPHGPGKLCAKRDSGKRLEGASPHVLEQVESNT